MKHDEKRGEFMNTLEDIEKRLREKGYKITNQRKFILEVFLEFQDSLLSAQKIYEKVQKVYPGLNFSTVYRNLELLEEVDIIHKIHTGEDHSTYKLRELKKHHHHFICKDCGKTEVIEFCPLKQMEEQLKLKQLIPLEHHFEIFGYCEKCSVNEKSQ